MLEKIFDWIATLNIIDMSFVSLVILAIIVIAYYSIHGFVVKQKIMDVESYNPEWMDYDKWERTRVEN